MLDYCYSDDGPEQQRYPLTANLANQSWPSTGHIPRPQGKKNPIIPVLPWPLCRRPIFFCRVHFWRNPQPRDGPVTFTHRAGVTTQSEQWKTSALEQQRVLRLNCTSDNTDSDSPPQYVQHHVGYSANMGTRCECLLLLALCWPTFTPHRLLLAWTMS